MKHLQNMANGFMRRVLSEPKRDEPEPLHGPERKMTGFLTTLTPEQRARILAYKGPENHGDPKFTKV